MPIVHRTSEAELDRVEIILHIARDNPVAAERFLNTIDDKCRLPAQMPEPGRKRFELAPELRSLAVGNYVIFYRPVADGIQLIRVLHGRRDIQTIFE
jgi:toxin ParE1/3/4